MSAPHVTTVYPCPRCGREHKGMAFAKFRRPCRQVLAGGRSITHWAMCPRTDEPVFLGFAPERKIKPLEKL